MPQFILGLIFGSLFTGAEVVGMLLLLPFVVLALAAMLWGGYEAVIWFDASRAAYEPAAWYAWPWNWPGAHLATEALSYFGPEPDLNVAGPLGPLKQVIAWPALTARAFLAIAINLMIAMIPLILLSRGLQTLWWLIERRKAKVTATEND